MNNTKRYTLKNSLPAVLGAIVFCALIYGNIVLNDYIVDLWASKFLVLRIVLCRIGFYFGWAVLIRICIAFWRKQNNYTGILQLNVPALLAFAVLAAFAVWDRYYGSLSLFAQSMFAIPSFTVLLCSFMRSKEDPKG